MDRRAFLSTGSAVALGLPSLGSPATALAKPMTSAAGGDARINALFEQIFQDQVRRSPELASGLGLDKGANAHLKSELDIRPVAVARAEDLARSRRNLAAIRAIPPASFSNAAKLNRDVVTYQIEARNIAPAKFGIDSVQRPYPIFQQGGAYFELPDFLNTEHGIATAADAEAYLSRLALIDTVIDNDTLGQRQQAARGFLAPAWSIDLTLGQMRKLREVPAAQNTLVGSIVRRTAEKGISGDWAKRAS